MVHERCDCIRSRSSSHELGIFSNSASESVRAIEQHVDNKGLLWSHSSGLCFPGRSCIVPVGRGLIRVQQSRIERAYLTLHPVLHCNMALTNHDKVAGSTCAWRILAEREEPSLPVLYYVRLPIKWLFYLFSSRRGK